MKLVDVDKVILKYTPSFSEDGDVYINIVDLRNSIAQAPAINIKFNVGDKVYLAETYHEYWANSKPYTIVGINFHMNEHTSKLIYTIEQDDMVTSVSEKLLFTTYEECKQWCKDISKRRSYESKDLS